MSKKPINTNGTVNITSGNNMVITGGHSANGGTSTSTTSCFMLTYSRTLERVEHIHNDEGNFIEITYREEPNQHFSYTTTWVVPNPPTRMVKERFGVVDGKLQLIKTILGKEEPGYYVPPNIEWEE